MLNMHAAAEAKDDANDSDDDDDDDGEATTSTQGGSVAKGDTEEAKGDTEAKEGVKKVEAKGDTEDEQPEVYEIASPKTAEQTRRDKAKTKLAANLREQAELEHTIFTLAMRQRRTQRLLCLSSWSPTRHSRRRWPVCLGMSGRSCACSRSHNMLSMSRSS